LASTVWRGFGLPIEMREVPPPQRRVRLAFLRDGPLRAQQTREVQPARMLGQVDQQVEAPGAQAAQQPPFAADLCGDTLPFPVAVDRVQVRDGRVAGQHRLGALIDQRVDFRPGDGAGECGEHRRGQQHVAMMA